MTKNEIHIRSSSKFKRMLKEINLERIKRGKSEKMLSDRRLTLGMTRVPNLKEFMINSDFDEFKDEK